MPAWLIAGLLGSIVLGALTILSTTIFLVPPEAGIALGYGMCFTFLFVYPGIGVLAALWTQPLHSVGRGTQVGALAGLVAGLADAMLSVGWMLAIALLGLSERYLGRLSFATLGSLEGSGLAFLFSPGGLIAAGLCNSSILILWVAVWGALGGAIYAAAAAKRDARYMAAYWKQPD
jgi:hypothetical protein